MKEPDYKQIGRLVELAQKGNSDSFATLYALTYNKIYAYACRYLRDTYLAQDAVQEIYIKALKNIHALTEPEFFVSWLNKIAFNTCYDFSTKREGDATPTEEEIFDEIKDDSLSSNPEEKIQRSSEYERLHKAIAALPAKEEQAITMKYFNHMKLEEIAHVMGASKSSVKRYIASAEETLRKIMT